MKILSPFLMLPLLLIQAGHSNSAFGSEKDPHSFANFDDVAVTHADLKLAVDFQAKKLKGQVTLKIKNKTRARTLILDTQGLTISKVTRGFTQVPAAYKFTETTSFNSGQALEIEIKPWTKMVTIVYETSSTAEALQWLEPSQTAGKKQPFLFTQSQAIFARSWIPLQDTPSVRMTYRAEIQVPKGLMAVMSASNPQSTNSTGLYRFEMPQPIPPYLFALAVGDLSFSAISKRSGVYAEPAMIKKAAYELVDAEKMIQTAEKLYGPYRWDRYDMIVLPPGFPYGGMENPRLTFLTPTFITGDRSLVNLIAHELSHSWTGNLVTNRNANHFWLNEGFTVYGERRIIELLSGADMAELQAQVGLTDVKNEAKTLDPGITKLRQNLAGIHPDDAFSQIPYEKGYLFLRSIEKAVGRTRFDAFFTSYIKHFAFQSIGTDDFLTFLDSELIQGDSKLKASLNIDRWINEEGLALVPDKIPSKLLDHIETMAETFLTTRRAEPSFVSEMKKLSTFEWLQWISLIEEKVTAQDLPVLDQAFQFSQSTNAEILTPWLIIGIKRGYLPALDRVGPFLNSMGRGKFVFPLFTALIDSCLLPKAKVIFEEAKSSYHAYVVNKLKKMIDAGASKSGCSP